MTTFTVNNGTDNIAGTLTYAGATATFTPDTDLTYDTLYTATIIGTVSDLAGNMLGTDYVWTFTTRDLISSTFKLPDTGQTTCYDGTVSIPCPAPGQPFYGQDASYTINPPSYTDNGDGTVTDNNTGLMWQQEDENVQYNWYGATGTDDATYNPGGAINACGALSLGGYTDWRLPTNVELEGITDSEVDGPAINSTYFPNTNSFKYWSSTTYANSTSRAWIVNLSSGSVYDSDKSSTSNYLSYVVKCVRAGPDTALVKSFTDNGDSTVTDNDTGLVWQQTEGGERHWESAL